MRNVDDGEEKKKKRMAFLVVTMSLPAVYHPNDDRWNSSFSWKNGDNFKSEEDLKKIRTTLKNEDDLKIEDDLNNACFFWVEFQKESTGNI